MQPPPSSPTVHVYTDPATGIALFTYDDRIEEPGCEIYFGCTLLCALPVRDGVGRMTRGHGHCEPACGSGATFDTIVQTGARLAGYDACNVRLLDVYLADVPTL